MHIQLMQHGKTPFPIKMGGYAAVEVTKPKGQTPQTAMRMKLALSDLFASQGLDLYDVKSASHGNTHVYYTPDAVGVASPKGLDLYYVDGGKRHQNVRELLRKHRQVFKVSGSRVVLKTHPERPGLKQHYSITPAHGLDKAKTVLGQKHGIQLVLDA